MKKFNIKEKIYSARRRSTHPRVLTLTAALILISAASLSACGLADAPVSGDNTGVQTEPAAELQDTAASDESLSDYLKEYYEEKLAPRYDSDKMLEKSEEIPIPEAISDIPLNSGVLPVLYINCPDKIKDDYSAASMLLTTPRSSKSYNCGMTIKLRGNSTRYREKHPYKIKLNEKLDLLDMGESRHWVLLANDIDHTCIRNKIVLDLARNIGMSTTSDSRLVNLVINGEYMGIYQLTEHIRVGKTSVNIHDWKDTFGDTKALDPSLIQTDIPQTGGFLLEADFYALTDSTSPTVITAFGQPFYFNTPEFISKKSDLYLYTKNYVQSFEYALHSPDHIYHADGPHYRGTGTRFSFSQGKWLTELKAVDYSDSTWDGCHYSELFDLDSLINNMIICEITKNWDSMKNSVFLYKDIEGPAYIGPVWDFDWAFGNINMYNIDTYYPTGWHTTDDNFTREQYYQAFQWNRYLIRDPYFLFRLYKKYHEIRPNAIEEMISSVKTYEKELLNDLRLNDDRWSYTYTKMYYGGKKPGNSAAAFTALKNFINTRMEWMDEQFADFETLAASFGSCKNSPDYNISVDTADNGHLILQLEANNPENEEVKSLKLQINGKNSVVIPYSTAIDLSDTKDVISCISSIPNDNIIQIYFLEKNNDFISVTSLPEGEIMTGYVIF